MSEPPTDRRRPVDEEARRLARRLVRGARFGALATIAPTTGVPMASRVSVASDAEGQPLLLVSDLSEHTGAMRADARCSLLVGEPGAGDPLAFPRISILGEATFLPRSDVAGATARERFLARHPDAALYMDFSDFHLVRITVRTAGLNGGFARAYALEAQDVADPPVSPELAAAFERARLHMNADHREAIDRLAVEAGATAGGWIIATVDAKGFEIARQGTIIRTEFEELVSHPADLRPAFVGLVSRRGQTQGE